MDTDSAITAMTNLGITEFAATLFVDLNTHGISNVTEISARTNIARTSVYRALDELKENNLVRYDGQNRTHYRAKEYSNLEALVRVREKRVEELNNSLPELFGYFLNLAGTNNNTMSIKYFEGQDGLNKAMINTLDTKGIYRIYELNHLHDVVDLDLAEHIRREMIRRNQTSHQITNIRRHEGITNVKGFAGKHWFMRYVDRRHLPIDIEIAIYNDIVAIYDYSGESFCIEIQSEQLARMQRGIFDYIWKTARKFKFIDEQGAAVLEK